MKDNDNSSVIMLLDWKEMHQERSRLGLFSELIANASSHTMALVLTQSLMKMSARKSSLGDKGRPAHSADNFVDIFEAIL
jgi:hypothetical protein